MKKPPVDPLILFLAVALLLAMVLTLLYGKGWSRHGYGQVHPAPDHSSLIAQHPALPLRQPLEIRIATVSPGVDPP